MNNRLPIIALFVVATINGFVNVSFRFIGKEGYFSVVFFILLFSSVFLLPILRFNKERNGLMSLKYLWLMVPLGFFQAAAWSLTYFAVMNTSISNAVFGYLAAPVFVIVLAPFLLKEPTTKQMLAALVLAIIGILLMLDPRNILKSVAPIGIVSGILAGFTFAMIQIIGRKLKDHSSPPALAFQGALIGALIVLPLSFLGGQGLPSSSSMLVILLLILGGTGATILVYYALRQLPTQNASLLLLLEPFVSTIAAFFLFSETPSPIVLAGGGLLLIADIVIIRTML